MLNPIQRLLPEVMEQILSLIPPGTLIKFRRINRECRNITKDKDPQWMLNPPFEVSTK